MKQVPQKDVDNFLKLSKDVAPHALEVIKELKSTPDIDDEHKEMWSLLKPNFFNLIVQNFPKDEQEPPLFD